MPSTENENLSGLGDFFSLISSEKKKKDEEVQSLIGDLGSVLLELDKASKQTKAVKKKQTKVKKVKKEPEVKVDVSNLFDELATLKKKEEEKKKREQEEIKAFESWLFTQPSEIKEEITETPEEPEEVVIEEEPAAIEEPEETEQVTEQVTEQEEIEEEVEEEPEEKEEENATVSQVLETLKTLIKDDIVEEKDTEIESLKKEIKDLRNLYIKVSEIFLHKAVVVKFVWSSWMMLIEILSRQTDKFLLITLLLENLLELQCLVPMQMLLVLIL